MRDLGRLANTLQSGNWPIMKASNENTETTQEEDSRRPWEFPQTTVNSGKVPQSTISVSVLIPKLRPTLSTQVGFLGPEHVKSPEDTGSIMN